MKAPILHLSIAILLGVLASGCTSPQKLLDYGNYDDAISLSIQKLAGKKKKNADLVRALGEAFMQANARDLDEAERLKRAGQPENWERVYEVYRRIDRRQEQVAPFLPLLETYGLEADVQFVDVSGFMNQARERSAEYLYARARQLLRRAVDGDRLAAREAFDELDRIGRYYRDFRDQQELMDSARALGTTHVLFAVENHAPALLPYGFERDLLELRIGELNREWQQFHLSPLPGVNYDYRLVMNVVDVAVTPGIVSERQFEESKEIEDGFEYVLDERGNVRKDSLGNDIKVPRRLKVKAVVAETYQQKAASLAGRLELYDLPSGRLLDSQPFDVETVFENLTTTFRGDERALSRETRRRLGLHLVPFPTDAAMLYDLADRLRPVLRNKIRHSIAMI